MPTPRRESTRAPGAYPDQAAPFRPPLPEAAFPTEAEALNYAHQHAASQGVILKTKRSNPILNQRYLCCNKGTSHGPVVPDEERQRQRKTKQTGCQYGIYIRLKKGRGEWVVSETKGPHNHPLAGEEGDVCDETEEGEGEMIISRLDELLGQMPQPPEPNPQPMNPPTPERSERESSPPRLQEMGFLSEAEALDYAHQHAAAHGAVLKTKRSNPVLHQRHLCCNKGSYHGATPKRRVDDSVRRRQRSSDQTNCPYSIYIRFMRRRREWVVTEQKGRHNHPLPSAASVAASLQKRQEMAVEDREAQDRDATYTEEADDEPAQEVQQPAPDHPQTRTPEEAARNATANELDRLVQQIKLLPHANQLDIVDKMQFLVAAANFQVWRQPPN